MKDTHTTVSVNCTQCGILFEKRRDRAEKHNMHFCSRDCTSTWFRNHPKRGKDNPSWKGGMTPEKMKAWRRENYQKHRKKHPGMMRRKAKMAMRAYRKKHPPEKPRQFRTRSYWRRYRVRQMREYRKLHPEAEIARQLVGRAVRMARVSKSGRSPAYLGCSHGFLRNHIESLFKPGMSWDNYGEWHVDHIVPLSWFPFDLDPSLLFVACHWTNLQPVWKDYNLAKKNKWVG